MADAMLTAEVRAHMAKQQSPLLFAEKHMADARALGAVLNAPGYLSGLNDADWNLVRDRARRVLHPEQVAMGQALTNAREELRKGVEATKRLVRERCALGKDDDGGGQLP